MLVRTNEHELARVERPRLRPVNLEDNERNAPPRSRFDDPRNAHGWIKTDERVSRAERVIKRAAVTKPQVRGAAAGNRRRREIVHRVGGVRLAVVSDDRRALIE